MKVKFFKEFLCSSLRSVKHIAKQKVLMFNIPIEYYQQYGLENKFSYSK